MRKQILLRKAYGRGQVVFHEGSRGECAYLVQSGCVEIVKTGADGEVILGVIGRNGLFGEMALIDSKPRMATARALEPSTLIVLSSTVFEERLAKSDPLIRRLLKIMIANLRSVSDAHAAGRSL